MLEPPSWGSAPSIVVDVVGRWSGVSSPSMSSQFPKPSDVMKLSTSSMAPALRAAFHSTADATQMIRKIDRKNSTEILSTDHGSMWRTMRRTLRARTFWRFGAFGGRRGPGRRGTGGGRATLRARLGRRLGGSVRPGVGVGSGVGVAGSGASTGSTPAGNVAVLPVSRGPGLGAPGSSGGIGASVGQPLSRP